MKNLDKPLEVRHTPDGKPYFVTPGGLHIAPELLPETTKGMGIETDGNKPFSPPENSQAAITGEHQQG